MSALRRFLVDFDAAAPPAPRAPWPAPVRPLFGVEPDPVAPEPAEPPVDRVALAVSEAVAAALGDAGSAHALELVDLAARHAAEVAAMRARWAAEEGAALAEGFRAAVAVLGETLGDAAASALEPLLGDAARALAVDGLRAAVADLVLAGAGGTIAVSGPADLLDALRAALGAAGVGIDGMGFTASDAAEVSVEADNSRIETRLGAFAGALGRRLSKVAWVRPHNLAQSHEKAEQECVGKPTHSCSGGTGNSREGTR